jgi:hypothetical protein
MTSDKRSTAFPYCGTLIDTRSLDLRIDIKRSYGIRESQEAVLVALILIDFDTEDVREILSVKWTRAQGASFSAWIKRYTETRFFRYRAAADYMPLAGCSKTTIT